MKKKLLIITTMYPHEINPINGIFVKNQILPLKSNYDIEVIATWFPHQTAYTNYRQDDINIHYIYFPVKIFFLSGIFTYRYFVLPRIKKLLREIKPDIIHVHDCRHIPELYNLNSVLAKYPAKKILTLHNLRSHPDKISLKVLKKIYAITLKNSFSCYHQILAVNKKLVEELQKISPSNKVSFIHNAISIIPTSVPPFTVEEDNYYKIIAVGNLIKTKGFDLLFRAVAQINCPIHIFVIGTGSEFFSLKALATELALKVTFTGSVENSVLRNTYAQFDAFVLPSWSETFGIVYLEAMFARLPVIGVRGQGIENIISDGVQGLLCEPQQVPDLKNKIEYLLQNPERARAMAEAGYELVKNCYLMENLTQKLINIYEG